MQQRESQVVEIAFEDIQLEDEIGRGSFAKVFRGKCRGQQVAIKVPFSQNFTDDDLKAFREEIAVMSQIHHPNLVLFMGACTMPGNLMIVTELMPRNLENLFLARPKSKRVTFVSKLKMAKDAALGMNWLHKSTPMFIHRDFKLSNLLVDENYNVKVCDFGLTKMKQSSNDHITGTKGSPLYMAPEVFTGSYSEKCDVYSFGLSFWEIINERRVFPRYENNINALIKARCENFETPPLTEDTLPRLANLLERCWDRDPAKRPSFEEIVRELDEIIIEECIADERGREMWKKYAKGEDKMQWDDFARAVCVSVGKIALPENYRSDRQMQCLKVLLCRQSEPNTVHAEKFGKVLAWFGPMTDERLDPQQQSRVRTFLERIEELLAKPWFHGELSTGEADERLNSRKPGTYLLRFSSSEKGAFTLSGLDKDKKKSHQRIIYHADKGAYELPDGSWYLTIFDAVKDLCAANKFKLPCPGSRYARYFTEEPQPVTGKNIAMVKEEIKQLQLLHLGEICDMPARDASLDTIDVVTGQARWNSTTSGSSIIRGLYPTGMHSGGLHSAGLRSAGLHSAGFHSGGWRNDNMEGNVDTIRIAPYIPPENTAPKSSTAHSSLSRPQPSASPHSGGYRGVTKHHASHGTENYYSAPMTGLKSGATLSSATFTPFATVRTGPATRCKELREEKKKGGLLSRLRRGVSSSKEDKSNSGININFSGEFIDSNHSVSSLLSGGLKSAKLGSSKRKNSKKEKKNAGLTKKNSKERESVVSDSYRDHSLPSDDEGSRWDSSQHMGPFPTVPSRADSTTASTNSIPAHALYNLQKVENEKAQRRKINYDSDSSTEDLYPPSQLGTSSSLSASSAYIKHITEERARHSHLLGGKEQEEQEEQEVDHDKDDSDSETTESSTTTSSSYEESESEDRDEVPARKAKDSRATEAKGEYDKPERRSFEQKSRGKVEKSKRKGEKKMKKRSTKDARGASLAATAPPHLMESVMADAQRIGRTHWRAEAPPSPRAPKHVPVEAVKVVEKGFRLDELPSGATLTTGKSKAEDTSPTSTVDDLSLVRKPKKTKPTGDGTERAHKKKHKKESSKEGGKKERKQKSENGGQRRAPPTSAVAENDESGREPEQTNPPGKKKKKKTDERTVIAVF